LTDFIRQSFDVEMSMIADNTKRSVDRKDCAACYQSTSVFVNQLMHCISCRRQLEMRWRQKRLSNDDG